MKVKRGSLDPLYVQIADGLRRRIGAGEFRPGAAIPAESELVRTLLVSRVTVRKAVDLLAGEGLVVRKQGKGTYVRPPRIRDHAHSLLGLAELLAGQGSDPTMEVLAYAQVAADPRLAQALALPEGAPVLRILRRHGLGGVPIALAQIYLPGDLGQRLGPEEVSAVPIYALLWRKCRIRIKRATEVIRAAAADRETARLLGLAKGAPLLVVDRVTYSEEERPVEYIELSHRHDSYEIMVELQRAAGPGESGPRTRVYPRLAAAGARREA